MTRLIQVANLIGVLALTALCAWQWLHNRSLNVAFNDTERARLQLVEKVEQQAKDLQGKAADLDDLRERLLQTNNQLKETAEKLGQTERRLVQLEAEREQLKASITNWVQAVAVRDEQIQKGNTQLKELMADRNQVVEKFNELAERHGKLVKDWNEQQARLAAANPQGANRGTNAPKEK